MKKIKYIFCFIIKVKKLLFFFYFNENFETTLNENNEDKDKIEKKKYINYDSTINIPF